MTESHMTKNKLTHTCWEKTVYCGDNNTLHIFLSRCYDESTSQNGQALPRQLTPHRDRNHFQLLSCSGRKHLFISDSCEVVIELQGVLTSNWLIQYQPEKRLHKGPEFIEPVLKHHLTHGKLEPLELGLLNVHEITGDLSELHGQLVVLIIVEGGDSGELWVPSDTVHVQCKYLFMKFTSFTTTVSRWTHKVTYCGNELFHEVHKVHKFHESQHEGDHTFVVRYTCICNM